MGTPNQIDYGLFLLYFSYVEKIKTKQENREKKKFRMSGLLKSNGDVHVIKERTIFARAHSLTLSLLELGEVSSMTRASNCLLSILQYKRRALIQLKRSNLKYFLNVQPSVNQIQWLHELFFVIYSVMQFIVPLSNSKWQSEFHYLLLFFF